MKKPIFARCSIFIIYLVIGKSILCADVVVPNSNLIIDGLPDITTELVERVQKYTGFRATILLDIHPATTQMLVKTRPDGSSVMQLHLLDEMAGKSTCLTNFADGIASACYQPTNGKYCVFSKDVDGCEKYQNYRYDFDTGKITLLTDGKSRNTLGIWSPLGDLMAFTSNERNGKDQDVYTIDPLNPNSKHLIALFSAGDSWHVNDWSPDGNTLLLSEYFSVNDSNLWTLSLTEGTLTLLTPKNEGEKIAYSQPRFNHDGSAVFYISDKGSEFSKLSSLDLKTGKSNVLTEHINWDIDLYEISPDGTQIVCVSNEDGISRAHLLSKGVIQTPVGVISKIKWEQNGENLLFNFSGAKSVKDIYRIEIGNGDLTRLTENKAAMESAHFVEPELITWKSFDGKTISGFLYRPSNSSQTKCPVRIVIHGGPESQFRPEFLAQSNYYMDELGIALLFPNIRGSTGYGKTFVQLPNGIKRVDAYEDLNTLLDWIKAQQDLDGDRIMVSGGSYGGHATLAVATRYNNKIACSLSVVGMSNLVTFLENTEIRRRDLRRAVYGDERIPEVREFLESIAPINHAKNITKPIFIIQGLMDPRVPYSESNQMVETLKCIGTPVWFLTAKNEGHGFSKKENVDFQFYATIEFTKRYLLKQ